MCYNVIQKGVDILSGNYTEARARANKKWMEKAYDRLTVTLPKGNKAIIQAAAAAAGLSVNGWITQAIEEKLQKESAEG